MTCNYSVGGLLEEWRLESHELQHLNSMASSVGAIVESCGEDLPYFEEYGYDEDRVCLAVFRAGGYVRVRFYKDHYEARKAVAEITRPKSRFFRFLCNLFNGEEA